MNLVYIVFEQDDEMLTFVVYGKDNGRIEPKGGLWG